LAQLSSGSSEDGTVINEMQEALKKSQGGILEGRVVDHLMLNYNLGKIAFRERNAVDDRLSFSGRWTREEREVIKLSSLSTDEIPKNVFSYFTKWSDFIAKDASCRCSFQISVSDITIQHLTVYFAHRGGKAKLGKKQKKRSAEHCAKISEALKGKNHSTKHFAKFSEAMTGKKHSTEHCAKINEAMTGKKHSTEHCAKISVAMTGKKRSDEHCAKISVALKGKKYLQRALCQD